MAGPVPIERIVTAADIATGDLGPLAATRPLRAMTFAEYLALDGANWSTLKELRKSPLAYKHALEHQRKDTAALMLGRATHTAVFEPDRLALDYAVWKGDRRAGKEWESFKAAHEGETILKIDEYERACAIRDAVRGHHLVAPYLAVGKPEHVLRWTDEKSGLALKGRLDWLHPGVVVDLKTARHATNPRLFASAAWDLGYYHQLAMYTRGATAVTGQPHRAVIVAVEPVAPHDVALYGVDENALSSAGGQVDDLLKLLVECRASDSWPGAFDKPVPLGLPRWALPNIEDLDLSDPEWAIGA